MTGQIFARSAPDGTIRGLCRFGNFCAFLRNKRTVYFSLKFRIVKNAIYGEFSMGVGIISDAEFF
jgi:hypothetical protein